MLRQKKMRRVYFGKRAFPTHFEPIVTGSPFLQVHIAPLNFQKGRSDDSEPTVSPMIKSTKNTEVE